MSFLSDVLGLNVASSTRTLATLSTPNSVTHTPPTPVEVSVVLTRATGAAADIMMGGVAVLSIETTQLPRTQGITFFAGAGVAFTVGGTGTGQFMVSIKKVA